MPLPAEGIVMCFHVYMLNSFPVFTTLAFNYLAHHKSGSVPHPKKSQTYITPLKEPQCWRSDVSLTVLSPGLALGLFLWSL